MISVPIAFYFDPYPQRKRKGWFFYITSPQEGGLRLLGPSSGQGVGGGARTRDRRVSADVRADSLRHWVTDAPRKMNAKKNGSKHADDPRTLFFPYVQMVLVTHLYSPGWGKKWTAQSAALMQLKA
ncbi:hypothetical protein PoB_002608800 [Plakobranchus ocellatus]|uniref:Uncharacterized protein n=1 Tax=Plakobranchus ocellatus TaxID=259542 RepID=A0AAV3ZYR6_9GAST|nr:hypothetical protein PoB_002608800 [Plakobranchus ocellatus]